MLKEYHRILSAALFVVMDTPEVKHTLDVTPPRYGEVSETRILEAQLRGMAVLLQQNAALETEVKKLCTELDALTKGVQKKGYLYKWREREIYYAPRWGVRYFILQGNQLSYYGDEQEQRPRRTVDLTNCYVREEGTKRNGLYHVFSLYLVGEGLPEEHLLMRLSSDNAVEAQLWLNVLEKACKLSPPGDKSITISDADSSSPAEDQRPLSEGVRTPAANSEISQHDEHTSESLKIVNPNVAKDALNERDDEHQSWGNFHTEPDLQESDKRLLSSDMLKRVQSSSLVLQEALIRHGAGGDSHIQGSISPSPSASPIKDSQHKKYILPPVSHVEIIHSTPSKSSLQKRKNAKNYTESGTNICTAADLPEPQTTTSKKKRNESKVKAFPAYKPMHLFAAPSPLSQEVRPGEYNFRGFFNLGIIILVLTHCELVVHNIASYGFKFSLIAFLRPPEATIELGNASFENAALLTHAAKAVATWFISILMNFSLEKYASKNYVDERLMLMLNYMIGTFNIVIPCYFVWTSKAHPTANLIYLLESVIIWMKLISYAHANKDLRVASRRAKRQERDGNVSASQSTDDLAFADNNGKPVSAEQYARNLSEVKDIELPFLLYPMNITLSNLLFYMVLPTLCYQLNYPRSPEIRWNKVVFLVARMIFVFFMVIFSVEQYITPTLEASVMPMESGDILAVMERLLRLSIPNTYVWLLGFYFYFHLWLNLLAELTRFGDRVFYKDWWNARTIDRYWRLWNMPVHHWVTRHICK